MDLVSTVALCILVSLLSAGATYLYLLKSASGRAMLYELAKQYGARRMRYALGMPHPDVLPASLRISPRFGRIYEQAAYSEQDGYDEVCGIAYGKALEVLIKDYASHLRPTDIEKIKKASLADCINTYIDDESIRTSTDLARWLRNDETHYERCFAEHGAPELRKLIGITMLLIERADMKRATDANLAALGARMQRDRSAKKKPGA